MVWYVASPHLYLVSMILSHKAGYIYIYPFTHQYLTQRTAAGYLASYIPEAEKESVSLFESSDLYRVGRSVLAADSVVCVVWRSQRTNRPRPRVSHRQTTAVGSITEASSLVNQSINQSIMSWTGQFGPPSQPQSQRYQQQRHQNYFSAADEYGDNNNGTTTTTTTTSVDAWYSLEEVNDDQIRRGYPATSGMVKPPAAAAAAAARPSSLDLAYEYYPSFNIHDQALLSYPPPPPRHHHHHPHHPPHHHYSLPSPPTNSRNNVLLLGEQNKNKKKKHLVNKKVAAVGHPPVAQQHPRPRRLNGNPDAQRKYNTYLQEYCQEHNIRDKVHAVQRALDFYEHEDEMVLLSLDYAMTTMTKLDRIVQDGMCAAEKRCRKLRMGEVPFSPAIKEAGERVGLYGLIVRYKKQQQQGYGKMGTTKIRRLAKKYNVDKPLSVTLEEAESNHKQAMREYKTLKPQAAALRAEFLQAKKNDPCQSDEYRQSIERMMQREERRIAQRAATRATAAGAAGATPPSTNNSHMVSPSPQSSATMGAATMPPCSSRSSWDQKPAATTTAVPQESSSIQPPILAAATNDSSTAGDKNKMSLEQSVDQIRRWCDVIIKCLETGLWPPPPPFYDDKDGAASGGAVLGRCHASIQSSNISNININKNHYVPTTTTTPATTSDHRQQQRPNVVEWTPDRQWTSVEHCNHAMSTSSILSSSSWQFSLTEQHDQPSNNSGDSVCSSSNSSNSSSHELFFLPEIEETDS
jgi:hypothetical protein